MIVALTGGTGFVGRAVLDEAATRDVRLRALTRRPQPQARGVTWVPGDLADGGALDLLVQGADAVLHIAGVVSSVDAAGFTRGNVQGTERVVAAARHGSIRRFVHVSSLAAREPGLSDYGRSKHESERVVRASGLDWTIVRPPAVYGPRDTELFQLFRAGKWGFVPMPPAGRTSIVHVSDLARLLLDLLPPGEFVTGRILEPDDGRAEGWAHDELARAIGRAVGRRVLTPRVPTPLFTVAARLDRLVRGAGAKLTPDRARYMVHPDWVCSPAGRVPESVWRPRIATPEGLERTAAWYREQRWL